MDLQRCDIKHDLVIIKINKSYYDGISAQELYEYTHCFWKRRIESVEPAKYALSVANGQVKEVYKIIKWVPASEADNRIRKYDPTKYSGRIAFIGRIAEPEVRDYYMDRAVSSLYKFGEADPVKLFLKCSDYSGITPDINKARKPSLIIQTEEKPLVVCPNCDNTLTKAPRCPVCGQLMLYGSDRWNKPRLKSLEEWVANTHLAGINAQTIADFVETISREDCFSYHIGAVDLALDLKLDNNESKKATLIMFFGGENDHCALQPKALFDYIDERKIPRNLTDSYFESLKELLSSEQKNRPYERENGYYFIDYSTVGSNTFKLKELYIALRNTLNNASGGS